MIAASAGWEVASVNLWYNRKKVRHSEWSRRTEGKKKNRMTAGHGMHVLGRNGCACRQSFDSLTHTHRAYAHTTQMHRHTSSCCSHRLWATGRQVMVVCKREREGEQSRQNVLPGGGIFCSPLQTQHKGRQRKQDEEKCISEFGVIFPGPEFPVTEETPCTI